MKRSRFPAVKVRPDGTKGCRGCGGDIPKGRLTWCSHECHETFDPGYVKIAVRNRAGWKCEMEGCGVDLSRAAQHQHLQSRPQEPHYLDDCKLNYPYDFDTYHNHPLYLAYREQYSEWKKKEPKAEYDHIIPHSEGGEFVLENIRLLCRKCHRARTAAWHKERAVKRRPMVLL